jgi:hypothetical protein
MRAEREIDYDICVMRVWAIVMESKKTGGFAERGRWDFSCMGEHLMRAKNVIAMTVCLLLTTALVAQKRNITEKDLFSFTWIGDTQISPDGSHAVVCADNSECKA